MMRCSELDAQAWGAVGATSCRKSIVALAIETFRFWVLSPSSIAKPSPPSASHDEIAIE